MIHGTRRVGKGKRGQTTVFGFIDLENYPHRIQAAGTGEFTEAEHQHGGAVARRRANGQLQGIDNGAPAEER